MCLYKRFIAGQSGMTLHCSPSGQVLACPRRIRRCCCCRTAICDVNDKARARKKERASASGACLIGSIGCASRRKQITPSSNNNVAPGKVEQKQENICRNRTCSRAHEFKRPSVCAKPTLLTFRSSRVYGEFLLRCRRPHPEIPPSPPPLPLPPPPAVPEVAAMPPPTPTPPIPNPPSPAVDEKRPVRIHKGLCPAAANSPPAVPSSSCAGGGMVATRSYILFLMHYLCLSP